MLIQRVLTALALLLSFTSHAQTDDYKVKNGLPCTKNAQCASEYCSTALPAGGQGPGQPLCMAPAMNCPIPGGDGILYQGEYNWNGVHWFCRRGEGLLSDGPERKPAFYPGGNCSTIFQKFDCRGDGASKELRKIVGVCKTGVCTKAGEPTAQSACATFCAVAGGTLAIYDREMRKKKTK